MPDSHHAGPSAATGSGDGTRGWERYRKGEGRDRLSNEELVSDLGVGLSLGYPVTQFSHLELYSLHSPSCQL